jgi:TRAP-type C4-dicarboxylate transport system substrate-binding protein
MSDDGFRRFFQEVKRMTLEQFTKKMNMMHSNAWHKCHEQYQEAIREVLPPSLAAKLNASHKRIVTEYDGLQEVVMNLKEISEADFIEVIQENRRIGYERMMQLVAEHCKNR